MTDFVNTIDPSLIYYLSKLLPHISMSPNFDLLQSDYLSVKPNLRALATEETVLNLCNKDVMLNLSSEHIVEVHRMKEKFAWTTIMDFSSSSVLVVVLLLLVGVGYVFLRDG